ncbi:hypothetical protein Ddye_017343 [Dipteronia dyeriana]|uniref:Uncharacterized protein n=1 Tax=Dipteronia dyeriana TaxID=168575 RepID=A0AAD9U901_9ROSI|nr:hypothetical protein Ddye_017343 [Dipteronia dyeriana]
MHLVELVRELLLGVQEADKLGGNRTQLHIVEQFRRLHPSSFEGTTNPLDAEEWHQELEKVFTFINFTDDQKVACVVFMLKGLDICGK